MAINKQKKKEIVEKAEEILKKSGSAVFINFKGLKVNDATLMRKALKEEGVSYSVVKKTLLKRAASLAKIEGEMPELEGAIAVVYSDDALSSAREIYNFQKKFKENLSIVGGIFEGKLIGREKMLSIATTPPLQVLRSQFVNLINSPIQGLVIVLSTIAEKKS